MLVNFRNLHYAHQGGWRFELYDSDAELVAIWNDTSHWGCNHDGTQQWVLLDLPSSPCTNCTLRLVRQALEWGPTYLFYSCAMVSIVSSNRTNATCNGCSGHGTCVEVSRVCATIRYVLAIDPITLNCRPAYPELANVLASNFIFFLSLIVVVWHSVGSMRLRPGPDDGILGRDVLRATERVRRRRALW